VLTAGARIMAGRKVNQRSNARDITTR
jgi:hypothetical protein